MGSDPSRQRELEAYVAERFAREDRLLEELRGTLEAEGLPLIQVPAVTARALQVLVRAVGASRVLEIGTLGGYSAVWIARGMGEAGSVLSLEREPAHAELARRFILRAGLEDRIEVRVGDARELLPTIGPDGEWDVVFLDADKENYVGYAAEAQRLLRKGGLLLADNALWSGRVLDEADDESTLGIQRFNDALARDPAYLSTILPVGDGVAVGVKL